MAPEFYCIVHNYHSKKFKADNYAEQGLALLDITDHAYKKGIESAKNISDDIQRIFEGKPMTEFVTGCITVIDPSV